MTEMLSLAEVGSHRNRACLRRSNCVAFSEVSFRIVSALPVLLCQFALRLLLLFCVFLHGLLLLPGGFLGSVGLRFSVVASVDRNGAASAQTGQDEKGCKSFHKVLGCLPMILHEVAAHSSYQGGTWGQSGQCTNSLG